MAYRIFLIEIFLFYYSLIWALVLDEMVNKGSMDSLKTRSLPAFLRNKQRPLSTEDDLHQLYAKVDDNQNISNVFIIVELILH